MKTLEKKRILVVDDDTDLRELLQEDFSTYGAHVKTAESGKAAMKLLMAEKFDVVFSDMRMPQGDGLYLIKEIIKNLPVTPLFFIHTGYSESEYELSAQPAIRKIFFKPCPTEEIVNSILSFLPDEN